MRIASSVSRIAGLVLLGMTLFQGQARAVLTIEITQGVEGAMPIAVVPFAWEGGVPVGDSDIAAVVSADLARSGRFRTLPEADMLAHPHDAAEVNYQDWRVLGMDSLAVGRVRDLGAGNYEVRFQLLDVLRADQLLGFSINARSGELRRAAHHISDLIYEKLTGERGAFNTRVAYITARGGAKAQTYVLQVADSDGFNPQTILTSKEPLMSPSWSPDGARLAYVSFENKQAEVYVQDVGTGRRQRVAAYPGLNGAPAWSSDGRRLALTLSKDGNPDIYVLDVGSGSLRRVTNNLAIDTEPAWAPDGQSLVFTSDRGGQPQIYRAYLDGRREQRLTYDGSYNARAEFSPDGKLLALVHGEGNAFHIAVLDLSNNAMQVLTDTRMDESPSFAPNGRMIIYATQARGRGVLAAVSVDGRVKQRLVLQEGDVREPAWSPFLD